VPEIDSETLEIAGEEAREYLAKIERNLLALEGGAEDPELIDALFRDAHSVKGAASMVGWPEVSSIAHEMEDRLEEARGRGRLPPEMIEPLLQATDELGRAVDAASAGTDGDHGGRAAPAASTPPTNDRPTTPPRASDQRQTMRVDAAKVDRMLDAVGETVLHQRRFEHVIGERVGTALDELAEEELDRGQRLLGELQDSVIEMRTLPLESITAPFPRAVRDLAAAEGKEADLVISGAETQLDRVILEGIGDPIIHLLRNAVAHGIESAQERARAGKPRRARVELRAQQRGGMVAIEVADDGRGVAPELLAQARESGSLADLLSTAGLSSAVEVGDLAGRGVGLDAAKHHVETLGGSVEVRSEPGRGTEVILLLPVTLALLNVLLCERGGQTFGVPVSSVREIVSAGDTGSLEGRRILEWRGEAIPLSDLAAVIGATAAALPEVPPAIVLASATRSVGIACDRVLGDRELVVKGLGPLLGGVAGYLGAALLEDGSIALVLDPNRLLEVPAAGGAVSAGAFSAPVAEQVPARVLVVDDQFSVRQLQRSILEASGYRVETAQNGRDALQKLKAGLDVAMVLSDLQMPEMDGLQLLAAIRHDEATKSLPVAIVTSKGSEEDKRRGAEAGADAYIVKEDFNQQALLDTIERLVGG
jgi:two-component system, chemotaxis family, sensor kinase CheA